MLEPLKASILSYSETLKPAKREVRDIVSIFNSQLNNNRTASDGVIGDFRQSSRTGDCYLLSALYSISKTKKGAALLKKNIVKNNNGSYKITLPGALIIKRDYANHKKPCSITGNYTITSSELQKAVKSGKYAKGDIDVVLYELAFEKYRREVMETNKMNHQSSLYGEAGQYTGGATSNSPLNGGVGHDAVFVLTGKKSKSYEISANSVSSVNVDQIKAVHSCSKMNRKTLERLLDKIEKNPDRYSATFGIKTNDKGKIGYHAVSISKIANGRVYFVNPWNTKKEFSMTKQDFLKCAYQVSVADMEEPGLVDNIADSAYAAYDNFIDNISNLLKK